MLNARCTPWMLSLVVVVGLAPLTASANVTLVSQHRQLITFATIVVEGDFTNSGNVFNDDTTGPVEFQDTVDESIGETTAHADAWHISVIEPSTVSLTGATGATASVDPADPTAFAEANGATSLSVHFDVTEPTEYVLGGGLSEGGAGDVSLVLTSATAGTIWNLSPEPNGTLPLSELGVLMPGSYVLAFSSGGYAQAGFEGAVPFASGAIDFVFDLLGVVAVPDVAPVAGDIAIVPNPVRYGSPVRIDVGDDRGDADVIVLDVSGRFLSRLTSIAGETTWDGTDTYGRRVAPGIYFARIEGTHAIGRIAILR